MNSSGALLPAGAAQLGEFLVVGGIDEARVRVAMHQRVDLQLGLVERVRRWVDHVAVDDFAHPRVQAHLRKYNQTIEALKTLLKGFPLKYRS